MNDNYKVIRWFGIVTLISLNIFLLASTKQIKDTAVTTNTISFNGEGKVSAKPDIAKIEFAIITEGKTSKEAQEANSPKSKDVVNFLKKQDIDDKDIKTISYNIFPKYNYQRLGNPEIIGYEVNQKFEVKVRDLEKTNAVVDGLTSVGVNNIANLGFTIDDPEKLQAEARAQAIADAKQKAQDLEKQLGINLGKIVNFSEGNYGFPGPIAYDTKSLGGALNHGPELPPGENEIKVDVTITYQIK